MIQDPEIIIGKQLAGETSPEENAWLTEWVASSEENRQVYTEFISCWELTSNLRFGNHFDTETALDEVKSKLQSRNKRILSPFGKFSYYHVAAAVIGIFLLSATIFWLSGIISPDATNLSMKSLSSGDSCISMVLPDGSGVWMNRNTVISFPTRFSDNLREVDLKGEAFFKVVPDKSKPFRVKTSSARIQVLGTSFNVKTCPDDQTTLVFVETGKVKIGLLDKAEKDMVLVPGEVGKINTLKGETSKKLNSDLNLMAWKSRELVFRETPLRQVAETAGAFYGISLRFSDENMYSLTLTGKFGPDVSGNDFANFIAINFGLKISRFGTDNYMFSEK
jgi:transmembrane sensor